jgi:hypothetical protein
MLRHLGEVARSNGIRYFVADILAENHAMLNVVSDADWPYERISTNTVLHIRVDLADICRQCGGASCSTRRYQRERG